MQLSLGIQSEYVVSHLESKLTERDAFFIYQTPASPNYYYGNLLALKQPLSAKSKDAWESCFADAFMNLDGIRHRTFLWTQDDQKASADEVEEFKKAGYDYEEMDILLLGPGQLVVPEYYQQSVAIRPFLYESDWRQWLEIGVDQRDPGHSKEDFLRYRSGRLKTYKALTKAGHGHFYGAFDGRHLVGYAGVFHLNGLARYQDVRVLEDYRRKGIARSMLYRMALWAGQYAQQQVIIADSHYHATKLYQGLGFKVAESEASLCWWPRTE